MAGAGVRGLGALLAEVAAVILVKVPIATRRLAVVHQHIETLALLAVEILHPHRFTPFGMLYKILRRRVEVRVLPQLQFDAFFAADFFQALQDPPLTGAHHDHARGAERSQVELEPRRKFVRLLAVAQLGVDDLNSFFTQLVAKMPHGRKKERDPLLVRPHMLGLVIDLRHPDGVFFEVEAIEDRRLVVELVAKDDVEVTSGFHFSVFSSHDDYSETRSR